MERVELTEAVRAFAAVQRDCLMLFMECPEEFRVNRREPSETYCRIIRKIQPIFDARGFIFYQIVITKELNEYVLRTFLGHDSGENFATMEPFSSGVEEFYTDPFRVRLCAVSNLFGIPL